METYSGGEDDYREGSGPLHVQRSAPDNSLVKAFLKSEEEAGYPRTDDINGYTQEVLVCWTHQSIAASAGALCALILTKPELGPT